MTDEASGPYVPKDLKAITDALEQECAILRDEVEKLEAVTGDSEKLLNENAQLRADLETLQTQVAGTITVSHRLDDIRHVARNVEIMQSDLDILRNPKGKPGAKTPAPAAK
ncbi:hypothetical protein WDW37_19930 [Bdellovibrionota bacterium FG-1]